MNKPLGFEEIMERLMRLDPKACIKMRTAFPPGPSRWYVCMGRVVCSFPRGGFRSVGCGKGMGGSSPEEATQNLWAEIIEGAFSDTFFLRYNCPDNVPIPGDEPQVWVRWNPEIDDWKDVNPDEATLARHGIPRERIRSYNEQRFLDSD